MRPTEAGRNVIVKKGPTGDIIDVNPPPFNARTRAHEYGGSDYVAINGAVYFSNFVDQRLYRQLPGDNPRPITPNSEMRFGVGTVDNQRGRLICIREDHSLGASQVVDTVVSLRLDTNDDCGVVLAGGNDFYSSPKVSPDGTHLAWLTWNHPNMPWDGCELWVGEFADDGTLSSSRRVAGGIAESIFQPEWSPDGVLYFASDRNGWGELERISSDGEIESVCETEGELRMPQRLLGMASYAFALAHSM